MCVCIFVCFFKQKTAYEMRISDWSSDVCSSDLNDLLVGHRLRIEPDQPEGHFGRDLRRRDADPAILSAAARIRRGRRVQILTQDKTRGARVPRAAGDRKSTRLNSSH